MTERASGVVQGTREMLMLRTPTLEPVHGYGIGTRLTPISDGVLHVIAIARVPCASLGER